MATRFLVPVRKGLCLSTPAPMPQGLSAYCHPDDFSASMARIESANSSPILARVVYTFGWLGYVSGLLYVLGTPYYMTSRFWASFGFLFVSLAVIISVGRYMRQRRAEKVAAAVAAEHAVYSSRAQPLSWTFQRLGWYRQAVEIEVLVSAQQLQIHALQHQLARAQHEAAHAEQHLRYDHSVMAQQQAVQAAEAQVISAQQQWIAQQQAAAQFAPPQFYPSVASPRPVYSAQQSVFAHPPPQYLPVGPARSPSPMASTPAVYPQENLRTPLFYSQY